MRCFFAQERIATKHARHLGLSSRLARGDMGGAFRSAQLSDSLARSRLEMSLSTNTGQMRRQQPSMSFWATFLESFLTFLEGSQGTFRDPLRPARGPSLSKLRAPLLVMAPSGQSGKHWPRLITEPSMQVSSREPLGQNQRLRGESSNTDSYPRL